MTPFDLTDYTNSKHKIPSTYLNQTPARAVDLKTWKILGAFAIDFMIGMSIQMMMMGVLQMSFGTFMATKSLQNSFYAIPFSSLSMSLIPLFFMSYYFFSYFFNHGQTYGQLKFKIRIEMPQMSFRASFYWAIFSTVLMLSCGLSYPFTYSLMQKLTLRKFLKQDHLYHALMEPKNLTNVNLLEVTKTFEQQQLEQASHEEESFIQAA